MHSKMNNVKFSKSSYTMSSMISDFTLPHINSVPNLKFRKGIKEQRKKQKSFHRFLNNNDPPRVPYVDKEDKGRQFSLVEALRKELRDAKDGLAQLDTMVDDNISWIHNNVESGKISKTGREKCRKIAITRLFDVIGYSFQRSLIRAWRKWENVLYNDTMLTLTKHFTFIKSIEMFTSSIGDAISRQLLKAWKPWLKWIQQEIMWEKSLAVVELQRVGRGMLTRLFLKDQIIRRSVTVIQCLMRRCLARKKVKKVKMLKAITAKKLAKAQRIAEAKRLKEEMARQPIRQRTASANGSKRPTVEARKENAVIKIQKLQRGKVGRRIFSIKKREYCARQIQKIIRGKFGRKRFDKIKEESKSKQGGFLGGLSFGWSKTKKEEAVMKAEKQTETVKNTSGFLGTFGWGGNKQNVSDNDNIELKNSANTKNSQQNSSQQNMTIESSFEVKASSSATTTTTTTATITSIASSPTSNTTTSTTAAPTSNTTTSTTAARSISSIPASVPTINMIKEKTDSKSPEQISVPRTLASKSENTAIGKQLQDKTENLKLKTNSNTSKSIDVTASETLLKPEIVKVTVPFTVDSNQSTDGNDKMKLNIKDQAAPEPSVPISVSPSTGLETAAVSSPAFVGASIIEPIPLNTQVPLVINTQTQEEEEEEEEEVEDDEKQKELMILAEEVAKLQAEADRRTMRAEADAAVATSQAAALTTAMEERDKIIQQLREELEKQKSELQTERAKSPVGKKVPSTFTTPTKAEAKKGQGGQSTLSTEAVQNTSTTGRMNDTGREQEEGEDGGGVAAEETQTSPHVTVETAETPKGIKSLMGSFFKQKPVDETIVQTSTAKANIQADSGAFEGRPASASRSLLGGLFGSKRPSTAKTEKKTVIVLNCTKEEALGRLARAWRCKLAYKKLKRKRELEMAAQALAGRRVLWATVLIQARICRGPIGRKHFYKFQQDLIDLRQKRRNKMATRIQCMARKTSATRRVNKMLREKHEEQRLSDLRKFQKTPKQTIGKKASSTSGGIGSLSGNSSASIGHNKGNKDTVDMNEDYGGGGSVISEEQAAAIQEKLSRLEAIEKSIKEREERMDKAAKLAEERAAAMEKAMKEFEERAREEEAQRQIRQQMFELAVGTGRSSMSTLNGPGTSRTPRSKRDKVDPPPTARSAREKDGIPVDAPKISYEGQKWVQLWDPEESAYYWYCPANRKAQWEKPGEEGKAYATHQSGYESGGGITDYSTDWYESGGDNTDNEYGGSGAWQEFFDESAQAKYWYNAATGEASWTQPEGMVKSRGSSRAASRGGNVQIPAGAFKEPEDWVSYIDSDSQQEYWYNAKTGETSWNR